MGVSQPVEPGVGFGSRKTIILVHQSVGRERKALLSSLMSNTSKALPTFAERLHLKVCSHSFKRPLADPLCFAATEPFPFPPRTSSVLCIT